jgi:hypothetical protein
LILVDAVLDEHRQLIPVSRCSALSFFGSVTTTCIAKLVSTPTSLAGLTASALFSKLPKDFYQLAFFDPLMVQDMVAFSPASCKTFSIYSGRRMSLAVSP